MAHPVAIGSYESQVPVQEGLRRIIPERSPGSIGPALEDVGNSVQQIVRSEAANYSLKTLSDTQSQWTQQFLDRQQSAQPGAPNFTPDLMKDYGDYVKSAVKGAPNGMAGKILNQQLTQFGNQLARKSMEFEAGARQSHNEETAKNAIEASGNELINDPTVYQQRLDERLAGIGALNMDPQVKDKLSTYAQQSLSRFAVMGDIQRDPYKAMLDIQSKEPQGYYKSLTPEQRTQLMDHADSMLHQRVADAERVHSLAKQQQQENSDYLLKQGIVMSQKGQLSAAWVIGHSATLEPSAMKYLLEDAAGKKTESDPKVYSDLLVRAARGEDTQQEITTAFTGGQLSKEDFTRLTDKSASEFPNPYKRGIAYINTAGKTSELEPDPAKTQTLANMQNDFQDWFRKNGSQASDKDIQAEAQDIVKRYQLVKADQNLLTLPVPQMGLGKGTRAAPDIQGAKKDLVKGLKDGRISREDFDRQAALLSQWQAAVSASAQRAAAAKAKQNE